MLMSPTTCLDPTRDSVEIRQSSIGFELAFLFWPILSLNYLYRKPDPIRFHRFSSPTFSAAQPSLPTASPLDTFYIRSHQRRGFSLSRFPPPSCNPSPAPIEAVHRRSLNLSPLQNAPPAQRPPRPMAGPARLPFLPDTGLRLHRWHSGLRSAGPPRPASPDLQLSWLLPGDRPSPSRAASHGAASRG